jgi:hypothetical protein
MGKFSEVFFDINTSPRPIAIEIYIKTVASNCNAPTDLQATCPYENHNRDWSIILGFYNKTIEHPYYYLSMLSHQLALPPLPPIYRYCNGFLNRDDS